MGTDQARQATANKTAKNQASLQKKRPSYASNRSAKGDNEDLISRASTPDSNRGLKGIKVRDAVGAASSEDFQSQVVALKPENLYDESKDPIGERLKELRIEVQKRDIMRKFEAIQFIQTKKLGNSRLNPSANPLMQNQLGTLVTTDHNGQILNVKQGGIPIAQPPVTTIKITQGSTLDQEERELPIEKAVSEKSPAVKSQMQRTQTLALQQSMIVDEISFAN